MSDPGKPPPIPPPPKPPPRVSEMYCPAGEATTISPAFCPLSRSITAPWPAKIPVVGKVTAVVKPALRAVSMRRSVGEISSAAFTQLVVAGRSSGPRTRVEVAAGAVGAAGVAGVAGVNGVVAIWPRPPRPAVVGAVAGAAPGMPQVLNPSTNPG